MQDEYDAGIFSAMKEEIAALKAEKANLVLIASAANALVNALKAAWGHQYQSADMWELRVLEKALYGDKE